MFQMTAAAANEFLRAAQRSDAVGLALRVAARQIADGSIEYGLGFDEEREDDQASLVGELTVLVGAPSQPLLVDTVLDFVEIESGRFDFVFAPANDGQDANEAHDAAAAPAKACGGGACSRCG